MSEIRFYGERGIVIGLLLDIKDDLDLQKCVLRSIVWCEQQSDGWMDKVQDAVFLIEPGFGEFGQPDLIITCHLQDDSRRFVIVEAKATFYSASAMSNDQGMKAKGYNSSINGQLSLDYRLALALQDYDGERSIQEPLKIFRQYEKQLGDPKARPRRAAKPQLMSEIVEPYLRGLRLQDTFFVAMTRDVDSKPLCQAQADKLPVVLDESGRDAWAKLTSHFGLLSLEQLDKEVLAIEGRFRKGCRTHIGPWRKQMRASKFEGSWFTFTNWSRFPSEWVSRVDELAQRIKDELAQKAECKRYRGSWSVIVDNKALGKLAPREPAAPKLMVGFSVAVPSAEAFADQLSAPEPFVLGPGKQPFLMVACDPQLDADRICDVLTSFIEDAGESDL